jgi:hypothetical protein
VVNIISNISVFVLIECEIPYIKTLNKGYNEENNKGFFHLIGYNSITNSVLIRKPIEALTPNKTTIKFTGIEIEDFTYKKNFKELLVFTLNNN